MLTLSAFRWQAVRTRVGTRRTRWTYGSAPVCKLQVGRGLFVAPETTCDSRSARKFLRQKFRVDGLSGPVDQSIRPAIIFIRNNRWRTYCLTTTWIYSHIIPA